MGRIPLVALSKDEISNIRLRYAAGESRREIADDYDVPKSRIQYLTKTPAQTKRMRERQYLAWRLRTYGTTDPAAILRKRLMKRYMAATGRDLAADLLAELQCPSPHSSLQPPAMNIRTKKLSSNGLPSRQQNSSPM